MATTAIFGAGVMGETLLSGLIRSGRDVADLTITEKRADHAAELNAKYGVSVLDNATAAKSADVLVLVVKPQDMHGLLAEIRDHVVPGNLVVSLAAGITTDFLESRLPQGSSVVRVMPNTPALVDQGMAAISPGSTARPSISTRPRRCCAPAASRRAGPREVPGRRHGDLRQRTRVHLLRRRGDDRGRRRLGLPRATSTELVVQTLFGAATMLKETGSTPVLRERVSSPAAPRWPHCDGSTTTK